MLLDFQFSNFRSFKDLTRLTMLAAPKRANDRGESDDHVFEWNGMRLLKSKAIYGANASGKSNVVRALGVLINMVKDSVRYEKMPKVIWMQRHLFNALLLAKSEPIFFQYIGILQNSIFRYGFQVKDGQIESEWLFWQESAIMQEEQIFVREKTIQINKKYIPEAEAWQAFLQNGKHEIFRSDALFLTSAALMGAQKISEIRTAVANEMILFGIQEEDLMPHVVDALELEDPEEKNFLQNFLIESDTGLAGLKLISLSEMITEERLQEETKLRMEDIKGMKDIASVHKMYNAEGTPVQDLDLPFDQFESEGTKRLLGMGVIIYHTLKRGSALIIDEFDSRLHPNLTAKILELFHNPKTNPNNAQLIFVTHDTGLLRRAGLRRDQIAIIDKDQYGASHLTTLIEYKGVRKDASLEKEYLRGAYRGVPNLNRLDDVVEDLFAE